MSNEELYHARLDRLLDAITNKEILIEVQKEKIQTLTDKLKRVSQALIDERDIIRELEAESLQKKITKQVTIEELREQFEGDLKGFWLCREDNGDYMDDRLDSNWESYLRCARGNNLIKEKL